MANKRFQTTIVFLSPPEEISDEDIGLLNRTLQQIERTFSPTHAGAPITKQVHLDGVQVFTRPKQMRLL